MPSKVVIGLGVMSSQTRNQTPLLDGIRVAVVNAFPEYKGKSHKFSTK